MNILYNSAMFKLTGNVLMGSPHHLDLRKRVMKAIYAGMAKTKASEVFNICHQTIYSRIALEKEQDHLESKNDYQNGHSHGIPDLDAFKKYANTHLDQIIFEGHCNTRNQLASSNSHPK